MRVGPVAPPKHLEFCMLKIALTDPKISNLRAILYKHNRDNLPGIE